MAKIIDHETLRDIKRKTDWHVAVAKSTRIKRIESFSINFSRRFEQSN